MQERHSDRQSYFNEQALTTKRYVIPFIQEICRINAETTILEIGCGEGGNLMPFVEMGCERVVGVDINKGKIDNAKAFFKEVENTNNLELVVEDIYNADNLGKFDLIIMRDVLEHIYDQEKFMTHVKRYLKTDGKFFLGFPPWQNPFGGHQQMARNKWVSKMPFIHLLPYKLYRFLLKKAGETQGRINDLIEIKDTQISIEQFERIIKKAGYHTEKRTFYFINPNYEIKFNLKPRVQSKFISSLPYLRNFFITTNYYVLSLKLI